MLKGDLDGSDKVNRKSMERLGGTVYSHETQIGIAVAWESPGRSSQQ
ncbi:hypothetical protein [Thermogymnomonas acidicola]|nr:hypothetical protein [Thermogymnomonas acidicola]